MSQVCGWDSGGWAGAHDAGATPTVSALCSSCPHTSGTERSLPPSIPSHCAMGVGR